MPASDRADRSRTQSESPSGLNGHRVAAETQLGKYGSNLGDDLRTSRKISLQSLSAIRLWEPDMAEFVMPQTQYARSGDINIAYHVIGDGPIDLLIVPGAISHLELVHELPGASRGS